LEISTSNSNPYLSILIPVYKSALFVNKTVSKINSELDQLHYSYEIILVNDGSPDNSWDVIKSIAQNNPKVKSYNLLKNYGQHSAVLCAIQKATGTYLITMDDDLQNPPSEIHKLVSKIEEGYDLVFGQFEKKKHAGYRKLGTVLINFLNKQIFNKPPGITLSNFRIFNRNVAKRVLAYKTNHPYIPGLLLLNANSIANTMTKHDSRTDGVSNYSILKILKLMSRLLINYSSYPLKVLTSIGLLIALMSFGFGAFVFIKAAFLSESSPGWASLMIMLSFLNGITILMTGILGIYVSRTLNQLSSVQPFIISDHEE